MFREYADTVQIQSDIYIRYNNIIATIQWSRRNGGHWNIGLTVGLNIGLTVGLTVGLNIGLTVGLTVGLNIGLTVAGSHFDNPITIRSGMSIRVRFHLQACGGAECRPDDAEIKLPFADLWRCPSTILKGGSVACKLVPRPDVGWHPVAPLSRSLTDFMSKSGTLFTSTDVHHVGA